MQDTQMQPANEPKQKLTITRTIQAPRAEVWKAFTEPDQVREWWGPRDFTAPDVDIDLREGGKYLYSMQSPDGQKMWSTGRFLTIDPPQRLVMTDSFADENGEIVSPTDYGMLEDFPMESVVTYLFEEDGNQTRLTLVYEDLGQISGSDLESMKQGWNESIDKMEEHIQRHSGRH